MPSPTSSSCRIQNRKWMNGPQNGRSCRCRFRIELPLPLKSSTACGFCLSGREFTWWIFFFRRPPFASHPFPTGRATLIRLSISDFTRDYIYDLQCTPVKAMTSWTKILGLWFSGKGITTGNTFFSSIEGISEVKITFFWYCYFYRNMSALIIMGVAGIFSLRGQIYNFVNITSKANMFNFI